MGKVQGVPIERVQFDEPLLNAFEQLPSGVYTIPVPELLVAPEEYKVPVNVPGVVGVWPFQPFAVTKAIKADTHTASIQLEQMPSPDRQPGLFQIVAAYRQAPVLSHPVASLSVRRGAEDTTGWTPSPSPAGTESLIVGEHLQGRFRNFWSVVMNAAIKAAAKPESR